MKSLQDIIYNWLSIQVVSDARPEDIAAKQTAEHFWVMLKEEYHLESVNVEKDEVMYLVKYTKEGIEKSYRFPVELIESMLEQIEQNPERYVNYE